VKKAIAALILIAATLGCIQPPKGGETTTLFVTTTAPTTTTTIEKTTTVLSSSTITTVPKTTSTITTTTIQSECGKVCARAGYKDGTCRINGMECRRRSEIYYPPGEKACAHNRDGDSCCCQPITSKNL
jgi:hypothetical protein